MDVQKLKEIDKIFRQFGIEGEDTFKVISAHYLHSHEPKKISTNLKKFWNEGTRILEQVKGDRLVRQTLEFILANDYYGESLPVIYQYFLTKRFRDLSGKFFTPQSIAKIMAAMLPKRNSPVIYDPTCGGGTFLLEASRRWTGKSCTLIGNDIDQLLTVLSEIVVLLSKPKEHSIRFINSNIYDSTIDQTSLIGKVDYILANPPFSLSIESFGFKSKLFSKGYRNSDALFLDFCLKILKPSGHLVCLLPHSIIVNKEFDKLRKTIEEDWEIAGVIVMPEGTFQTTSNTTTRADILHLVKKAKSNKISKVIFGNISDLSHLSIDSAGTNESFKELSYLLDDLGIKTELS